MLWLIALIVPLAGASLFVWFYGRHLDTLSGQWMAREVARHG
ncbi:hypothetical protein [Bradyrhizobium centrolobii]|nr:hypothetical protein [Bradyrhizobium centrolobii]